MRISDWSSDVCSSDLDPAEISLPPPLPNPASTARRKPPRNWNVNQDTTGIAGKRFLVIEDEALVAFELASILEDAGAIVEGPAGSAGEALRIIESTALDGARSEEHTYELQSLMRISYAV